MPRTQSLIKQNSIEVPLYTPLDAARYLHVPLWAVLPAFGYPLHPFELLERFWHEPLPRDDYSPVFRGIEHKRISFGKLAALFVSSAIIRPLFSEPTPPWIRIKSPFRVLDLIHQAIQGVLHEPEAFTDPDRVLRPHVHIYNPDVDRETLLKLIALHQARVELKDGAPIRLFPFSRDPAPDVPRTVVIDPEVRFGRPTVKGAPTDILSERWRAGDNSPLLADDYGLTPDEVDEALRFEASPLHQRVFFPLIGL